MASHSVIIFSSEITRKKKKLGISCTMSLLTAIFFDYKRKTALIPNEKEKRKVGRKWK